MIAVAPLGDRAVTRALSVGNLRPFVHDLADQLRATRFLQKPTCTFGPVALHTLQRVPSDRTSVTLSVRTSVTVGWWLGGAALSVGAPLLPTQGSLTRSLSDGLWPPLTWEPLRRPWAG